MTQKRSRLQIYLDVLRVINNGVQKPTHIMYKCNLSWVPLKEVLESLMAQGLLVKGETKQRKIYEITEKGKDVLRYFDKAKELIAPGPFSEFKL